MGSVGGSASALKMPTDQQADQAWNLQLSCLPTQQVLREVAVGGVKGLTLSKGRDWLQLLKEEQILAEGSWGQDSF